VRHSFTAAQTSEVAARLERCGLPIIEVSHGDGLGGSSYTYGFSKEDPFALIEAASKAVSRAKIAVLLLPGIGTIADMERARDCGASVVRVATHVTEADVSAQHIQAAKRMDYMAVGFLMMVHMLEPGGIAEQAKKMESYGADYINLADSAGALLPDQVKARVEAVRSAVNIPVGFHAHNNLSLAVANSLAAIDAGASYIDATLRGSRRGLRHTQLEVLAGVLNARASKPDWFLRADRRLQAGCCANDVASSSDRRRVADARLCGRLFEFSAACLRGCRKVPSRTARYPRRSRKRKMIGGQEDLIIDVAYSLAKEKQG
jgi:4-hydroxy 2-oxovalerate aldolase